MSRIEDEQSDATVTFAQDHDRSFVGAFAKRYTNTARFESDQPGDTRMNRRPGAGPRHMLRLGTRSLEHVVLAVDRPVLVVPDTHDLAARGRAAAEFNRANLTGRRANTASVTLGDLADEPFVAYDRDAPGDPCRLTDQLLTAAGIEPRIAHTATSELAVLGLVAAGCGIGIVSGHASSTTALPVRVIEIEPTLALYARLVWVPGRTDGPTEGVVATISSSLEAVDPGSAPAADLSAF